MKINKILAAGVAATLAVTSLAAVASAEVHEKKWDMAYTEKSGSAEMNIAGYINKLYQDVEQADQQMLVFDLGKDNGRKVTINGVEVTDFSFDGSPKLVVEGRKETGKNAVGDAVYQSVTREYTLVKFTRKDSEKDDPKDGNEGKWCIAVLKDSEPTYKDGEFAPAFFDKIDKVSITYKVKLGKWTDKDQWNNKLKDKDVTIDVGNVYLYEITDDDNDNLPEYGTPVVTYLEGDKNYPQNLQNLIDESANVGKGQEAVNGYVALMIYNDVIEDAEGNVYTFDSANKAFGSIKKSDGAAVDITAGKDYTIGGRKVTFVTAGGTDSVTRRVNAQGKTVAFEVVVDAAKITVDGLTDGDIYEIPVVETDFYTNPALTDSKGNAIKYATSAVTKAPHGAALSIGLEGKDAADGSDNLTLIGVKGTKVPFKGAAIGAAANDYGPVAADGKYTPGLAAADDGDGANDAYMELGATPYQSIANTASAIIAYATVDGGWKPSEFSYTPQPTSKVAWDSADVYPLLYRTTVNSTILRNDVWVLSDAEDYRAITINGNGAGIIFRDFADQSYKNDDKPEGTKPFRFAGMASQFGDFFNKQNNGTVTFKFTPEKKAGDDWKNGGVPSSETGLKNALGDSSFGLFVNYNSSTGQLQAPGVVDDEALTVTFDVATILDDMGGLTKGNVTDIYYGLNKGLTYDAGVGYYVEEVKFSYDDAAAAVDASADADNDDDAAVVVADDDDDDDVIEDDDIIEDDDDDDDDDAGVIEDDDDDDTDVNNDTDFVDADDDANPGTGVGLAVIPAIVAAAAVVVSKKRK